MSRKFGENICIYNSKTWVDPVMKPTKKPHLFQDELDVIKYELDILDDFLEKRGGVAFFTKEESDNLYEKRKRLNDKFNILKE